MKWQDVKLLLGGGTIGIVALFSALFLLAGVESVHSGDVVCGDVCESQINITTSYWRICFEDYSNTKYENETLFKKQSRSRTLHVNLGKVEDIIRTEPRIKVDWLVPTYGNNWRPIKDGDCWERGEINKVKLVGYKHPSQTVKWNFDVGDEVNIDPMWYGLNIGYAYLNDSGDLTDEENATIVHLWNNITDYYFNKSSGIQFTNHFQDYWTHNIFCGGYKNASNDWVYDCNDELPFNWNLKTDNLTYVNYTGWRDKTIGSKTVRLGIRYALELNDENLPIQLSVENLGSDISDDLGFAWRVNQIQINGDVEDDMVYINGTYYNLSDDLDLEFINLDEGYYRLEDEWFVSLNWSSGLTHKVEIKNTSQYNAPVTLGINVGTLNAGQQKATTMYWQDPPAHVNLVDEYVQCVAGTLNVGETTTCTVRYDALGSPGITDDYLLWLEDDTYKINNSCGSGSEQNFKVNSISYSAPCDSDNGYEVTCDGWDTGDDNEDITWTIEACDEDSSNTIMTDGSSSSNGDYEFDETDSIVTVEVVIYGNLSVNITSPTDNSQWDAGEMFDINATVTCTGTGGVQCGTVYAYAMYNATTATPNETINTTDGAEPFYVYIGGDYGLCYQETATTANACGGLATGAYASTGSWNPPVTKIYDADWTTYSASADGTYFVNYTKPLGTTSNTRWEIRDGTGRSNMTINDSCLDQDTIQFRVILDAGEPPSSSWECHNATGWVIMKTLGSATNIYEEAMNWDIREQSNPQSSVLNQDESFNVSWTINVTTTDEIVYSVGARFNSSFGEENITTNDTTPVSTILNPEITPPILTIISPLNNSEFDIGSVDFNVSSDIPVTWCGLSISGAPNVTMTNTTSTNYNYTNTSISDGNYDFVISCNDTENEFGATDTYYFLIDTIQPFVNFTNPTPLNASTQSNTDIYVNLSTTDANTHYSFVDFDKDLLLWMRMDEYSGTTLYDNSSYGNDGEIKLDPTQTTGYWGDGFRFDGDGGRIEIDNSPSIYGFDEFSVSMWAYVYTTYNNSRFIEKAGNESNTDRVFRMMFNTGANHNLTFSIWNNTDDVGRATSDIYFPKNRWVHIVGVYNGTNTILYLNGTQQTSMGSVTGATASYNYANNTMKIGGVHYATYFSLNGTIDDVLIFNRSLTQVEINSLYNATAFQYENNFTSLSYATHNFTGYAVDTVGNVNSTSRQVTVSEVVDTCSPSSPLTSNYQFECSDNCVINSEIDAGGYDITINGTGSLTLEADIVNWHNIYIDCSVYCNGGCFGA